MICQPTIISSFFSLVSVNTCSSPQKKSLRETVRTIETYCIKVKSDNFGHQVNSDSDHVRFIF